MTHSLQFSRHPRNVVVQSIDNVPIVDNDMLKLVKENFIMKFFFLLIEVYYSCSSALKSFFSMF